MLDAAAAGETVTVSGRTGAGGRGCADAVPVSVTPAISDDVAIVRHLSARLLVWCIGDLPGNQTDGLANTVSRLCVPASNVAGVPFTRSLRQRRRRSG